MGKTIVSWSPMKGQGGTTSNTAALASMFSLEYEATNLITHTEPAKSNLESMFGKEFEDEFIFNGVSALKRLAKSGMITHENIHNYVETVFKNRLDILCNTDNSNLSEKFMQALIPILKDAYGLVWVDTSSGMSSETSLELVKDSDLLLLNLPQNKFALDAFFSSCQGVIPEENVIVLIGMHDESILPIRKIKKEYGIEHPVFPVPYSSDFKNSSNKLMLPKFFYQNSVNNKDNHNSPFISALRDVNKEISKIVKVEAEEEVGI